ncbi:hypothetical protein B0J18DRAFT_432861 [Chaetomium sp. MPI-SDFR-AT-0129]|nr:hypothetical protein B0J18DRAFT_432861 [Chaetomium sp. MPI-SDFR-AT-0129]
MTTSKNILITGGAGLVGPLLAARLLSTPDHHVLLTDLAPPCTPPGTAHPDNLTTLQGDITSPDFVTTLVTHPALQPLHAVYILHGIMSAAAEADPALSQRVNVDSVRLLADTLLAHHPRGSIRVIYTSSLAVFGPPFPPPSPSSQTAIATKQGIIPPNYPPTPQSTYGTHKLQTELHLNNLHRLGAFHNTTIARLPTLSVRPGKPTGAASSFLSGIIREPMAGVEAIVPLTDRSFRAFLASPRTVVENLVRVLEWEEKVLPERHLRSVVFPGVAVSVQELRDALGKFGGEEKVGLIREVRDEGLEGILRGWGEEYEVDGAVAMGLVRDESGEGLVREYIEGLKV